MGILRYLAAEANSTTDYVVGGVIIGLIVISIIFGIVSVVRQNRRRAEEKTREVNDVVEKGGVRYTPDATIVDKEGNDTLSYIKGDIIIKPRKTMKVGKNADIKPGKWTVLAANDTSLTFNIRLGNYVKEYKHGQEIVLAEGDEICPTSTTIILR
ncbi:MAG: hypothetical protein IJ538_03825 [Clostridia bacterium]|nr:hypothetical protein [Clostridia bacterium]